MVKVPRCLHLDSLSSQHHPTSPLSELCRSHQPACLWCAFVRLSHNSFLFLFAVFQFSEYRLCKILPFFVYPDMHLLSLSREQAASMTEQKESGSVQITTWILLGFTVSVFVARQVTKAIVFRKVALDDLFMVSATVRFLPLSFVTLLMYVGIRDWAVHHCTHTSKSRSWRTQIPDRRAR
jgi:hypothetical protein